MNILSILYAALSASDPTDAAQIENAILPKTYNLKLGERNDIEHTIIGCVLSNNNSASKISLNLLNIDSKVLNIYLKELDDIKKAISILMGYNLGHSETCKSLRDASKGLINTINALESKYL